MNEWIMLISFMGLWVDSWRGLTVKDTTFVGRMAGSINRQRLLTDQTGSLCNSTYCVTPFFSNGDYP